MTRLGKWWGRKPLILVRAAIVGMLMPNSSDPKKDREIFLKILKTAPSAAQLAEMRRQGTQMVTFKGRAPEKLGNLQLTLGRLRSLQGP